MINHSLAIQSIITESERFAQNNKIFLALPQIMWVNFQYGPSCTATFMSRGTILLPSPVVSFQPVFLSTTHARTRTVIPVSAQRKTGISQTLARAGKDEIPARRFAWPE
ncbi:MAG TPA: hypothetical protein ENJ29_05755 [Bacteroidetes bacterium]|nr:hypothetical protein [Bacteroidota bacterium]